jgi:hypothetical protein
MNEEKKGTYMVFVLIGYQVKDVANNFVDKVVVRLIDTDYESALERAKKVIEKPLWFLAEVIEYQKGQ